MLWLARMEQQSTYTPWILSQGGPPPLSSKPGSPRRAGGVATLLLPMHARHPTARWLHRMPRNEEVAGVSSLHFSGTRTLALELPENVDRAFYDEFCNGALWPLFHGLIERCAFNSAGWNGYVEANRLFARSLVQLSRHDSTPLYLIQDFHFALVPRLIRGLERTAGRPRSRISVFWHVPWPEPGLLEIHPWLGEFLDGICSADVLVFQTARDEHQFRSLFRSFGERRGLRHPRLEVLGASISPHAPRSASSTDLEAVDEVTILGVDRIDYTKGILQKLRAFALFAQRNPNPGRMMKFLQIGAPCREKSIDFQRLRQEIEATVSAVREGLPSCYSLDWRPFTHSPEELRQLSQSARVAWVTPLRDGMNLFAQEFVQAQSPENPGVLVLSRFAGVAQSFRRGSLQVNPWNPDEMAERLEQAVALGTEERMRIHACALQELAELSSVPWGERLLSLSCREPMEEVRERSRPSLKIAAP